MTRFAVVTRDALLVVREGRTWTVEAHLEGMGAESAAADGERLYVGTMGKGLFRSRDGGGNWEGVDLPQDRITAVAVQGAAGGGPGVVFAGTEPSTLWRSDDGGERWRELTAMTALPSSSTWRFPPKPDTHHVRWIEPDPHAAGRLYVAIEAGALVRTADGGETWMDRVADGPYDTHTAATHREAEGRVYSAAGDGYYESVDGGESWKRLMDGLGHRYLVGVAVDAGDAETVVVSAASGPGVSYHPRHAEAYVYRKHAGGAFEMAMEGLPAARGTVASRLAAHADEPHVFYAANNQGLFRSEAGGQRWEALPIEWPEGVFRHGVKGLVVLR